MANKDVETVEDLESQMQVLRDEIEERKERLRALAAVRDDKVARAAAQARIDAMNPMEREALRAALNGA